SVPSLIRGLVNSDATIRRRLENVTITIITGSASNEKNRSSIENALPHSPTKIRFRTTMHSNPAIDMGIDTFLKDLSINERHGYLSEGSKANGNEPGERLAKSSNKTKKPPEKAQGKLTIKYPFNINRLRSDVSRDSATRREPSLSLIPGFRPLSL